MAAATHASEPAGKPTVGNLLCAIYPQDEIVLHAFHRLVRGPVAVPELIEGLTAQFELDPATGPSPEAVPAGCLGLHAGGRWWTVRPRRPRLLPGVAGLDVTMLDQQILRPLLGVEPGDPRLQFVPALRDVGATARQCDAEEGVLFTLHAPRVEDIVSVAERHEVMSAKTTYVLPKPRTGIFLS